MRDSASSLRVTGYFLTAITVLYALGIVPLYRYCQPALRLLPVAAHLLRRAPGAMLVPLAGAAVQLLFVFLWLSAGAWIASSGKVEVSPSGYASLLYSSPLRDASPLFVFGGVWTVSFLSQMTHLIAVDLLAASYWQAAELRRGRPPPTWRLRLRLVYVHLGSAALGALICPIASPGILLQAGGFHFQLLESMQDSGYVGVALFGVGLRSGGTWASTVTRKFLPQLLTVRAQCCVVLLLLKIAIAATISCVAAILLLTSPEYNPSLGDGIGVTDVYVPLVCYFLLAFLLASPFVSVVQAFIAPSPAHPVLFYPVPHHIMHYHVLSQTSNSDYNPWIYHFCSF